MREWLRLLTPPEWSVWSLFQRAVYWLVFLSIMAVVGRVAGAVVRAIVGVVS